MNQSFPHYAEALAIALGSTSAGVGNASDFTGRTTVSPQVLSHPHLVPVIARDLHKQPVNSFARHAASSPVPARLARPGVGRREGGGKSRPPCRVTLRAAAAQEELTTDFWHPTGAAVEDRQLVAQDEELRVVGCVAAGEKEQSWMVSSTAWNRREVSVSVAW